MTRNEETAARTVIIGGTSGIGLATADLLARSGHEVVVTGRDRDRLATALGTLPAGVRGESADAADLDRMRTLFTGLGAVDHVVVAATGAAPMGPVRDLDRDPLLAANAKLWMHVATARAALPVLATDGSLTFVSAVSAWAGSPGTAALATANAAVESMVRVLAAEEAPRRVNAVSPGVIDTPWWDWLPDADRHGTFATFAKGTPVGRVGTATDVAAAIAYLIGSTFTTGVVLPCDGGLRLAAAS